MQTKSMEETGLPAQNFAVLALQRRVFSRSNIRFMFVNKQSVNYSPLENPAKSAFNLYNRNVGLEYNLASSNNRWVGKSMFLKSFSPQKNSDDLVHAANLQYTTKKWLPFPLLFKGEKKCSVHVAEAYSLTSKQFTMMVTRAFISIVTGRIGKNGKKH